MNEFFLSGSTWQVLEALDDFPSSLLHRDAVLTEHQTKHHQRNELTGVGLLQTDRLPHINHL